MPLIGKQLAFEERGFEHGKQFLESFLAKFEVARRMDQVPALLGVHRHPALQLHGVCQSMRASKLQKPLTQVVYRLDELSQYKNLSGM